MEKPVFETYVGTLRVCVYRDRKQMGRAAAAFGVQKIEQVLARKEMANVVFAAAPSQFELYEALAASGLDFSRIRAFHMDEYIGLPPSAPQGFGNLLRTHLFSKLPFAQVFYFNGTAPDPQAECARMSKLLLQYPPDMVFHGIGENGHLAFNDPPNADFDDPASVKVVAMDEVCRMQQVHDGCFASIEDVPTHAYTMTIPQLTAAVGHIVVTAPGPTKTEAVYRMLREPVSTRLPASILRKHGDSVLVLDADAAKRIMPMDICV